jgi:Leucine-rich repeat (LRR) protein
VLFGGDDDAVPSGQGDESQRTQGAEVIGEPAQTDESPADINEVVQIDLSEQNITNEILAQMVADGTIPANVTNLTISYNQITDISPLNVLTSLIWLDAKNNQIVDIPPLNGLANLTHLDISYNQITDISSLSELTNLRRLNSLYNQITDISPLSGLANLTGLNLENNQITDLTPLSGFTNLSLNLHGNPITDWSPVAHIVDIRDDDE